MACSDDLLRRVMVVEHFAGHKQVLSDNDDDDDERV